MRIQIDQRSEAVVRIHQRVQARRGMPGLDGLADFRTDVPIAGGQGQKGITLSRCGRGHRPMRVGSDLLFARNPDAQLLLDIERTFSRGIKIWRHPGANPIRNAG